MCDVIYSAVVGCREANSKQCADGQCLPSSVTCDGVQYCHDGSTYHTLCGKLRTMFLPSDNAVVYDCLIMWVAAGLAWCGLAI